MKHDGALAVFERSPQMAPSCSQASEGLGSKHAEAHSLKRPGRAGQKRAIRGQRATQDMKRMEYGVPVSGRPLWFPLRRTGVAIPYQGPYKYARRLNVEYTWYQQQ